MEQYIRQIIKKYNDLFDENTSIEKVNVGFTNLIYILDKKFILKICSMAPSATTQLEAH
mgnify:CR=1 FL=1